MRRPGRRVKRRCASPRRHAAAPQEARRPELFPAAGCAWGTHYLSILFVKPCKDLFKFYLNALVNVPREDFDASCLARLQPSLDLEAVTAPVNLSSRVAVSDRMRKAAEAYAKKFDHVVVEEEEDAADEEESAAADDGGTLGGPMA